MNVDRLFRRYGWVVLSLPLLVGIVISNGRQVRAVADGEAVQGAEYADPVAETAVASYDGDSAEAVVEYVPDVPDYSNNVSTPAPTYNAYDYDTYDYNDFDYSAAYDEAVREYEQALREAEAEIEAYSDEYDFDDYDW